MLMLIPVCNECAKVGSTDALCAACATKLSTGQINEHDIAISNFLFTNYPDFDIEFLSSYTTQKCILLFMRGKVARIIGDGSSIAALEKKIGKKVKVINVDHDFKKIVSDIIYPATLLGINIIFGSKQENYKIRIAKEDLGKFPFEINAFQRLFSTALKKNVQIIFE